MTQFQPETNGSAGPSGFRSVLLAAVAGVGLIAAASITGLTELAPWTGHAQAAAVAVNPPATAPFAAPSFANLVADARGLAQSIARLAPGTSVKLDIVHGGQSRSVDVTLGDMPAQQ